jgi:hypothetical protein
MIAHCSDLGPTRCSPKTRAGLYIALGIVLEGGRSESRAAIQAFHTALVLDPEATLTPEYATASVQKSFLSASRSAAQARGGRVVALKDPSPYQGAMDIDVPPATREAEEKGPQEEEQRDTFLLISGVAGVGVIDGSLLSDMPNSYGSSTEPLMAGLSVTVGGMPNDSRFAIGGRARIVTIVDEYDTEEFFGVSAVMGAIFGERTSHRFGYVLGGLGLERVNEEPHLGAHALGGISLNGFLLGGSLETAVGEYSYGMALLHVGFGGLL